MLSLPSGQTGYSPSRTIQRRSHKSFYDRIEAAEAGSMARRVHRVIEATRETAGDNQAAYICFMAVRLVHCYRVLKPTGSIYVHCDYKSDSHLRMLMDAIFGTRNFRNEIVWCYTGNSVPKKNFQAKHDTILFYAKSESSSFSLPKAPYSESTLRRYNHVDDDGRRYKMSSLRSGLEKVYAKDGKPMEDWWSDIPVIRGRRSTGYSTQKPLELARRIIEASSNPGGLVADLFAGCATTLVAAEVTGRRWLGCDWAYRAWTMNKRRFVSIPDGYGGLTGTTEATLRALGLEGAQIPPLESFTIGPPDLDGLPTYSIEGVELAVASAKRRDPTWTGRYSKDEAKREMLAEWGAICWGCGWEPRMPDGVTPNPFYLQVDHSLARSRGGEDELYNLSLLCPECNARKRDREMEIVELRQENDRRDALHMSIATLNKRVPLARIRKWAQGKMDERPRLPVGA